MQAFELSVLDWIQANVRCVFLDTVMPAVSALSDYGEIWILLAVLLLIFPKTRRTGMVVAVSLLLDLICCNLVLKPLVARIRPCDLSAVELLIPRPGDYSFPSGHTAASFAAAGALHASGSRLTSAAYVLAVLIGLSRLYLYVHWPSDVLAGAALGIALGYLSRWLIGQWILHRRPETD